MLVAGAQRSMRVCLCSSVTLRQLNHSITVFEIISLLLEIISLRRVRRGRESVTPWVRPWVDSGLFSVQIVNIEHVLPHSPPPFSQRNRNSRGSEYSWNGTEERCHSLTLTITHTLNNTHNTRRWRWIGHVLRMPPTSLPRVAHRWTPDAAETEAGPRRLGGGQWRQKWRSRDGPGLPGEMCCRQTTLVGSGGGLMHYPVWRGWREEKNNTHTHLTHTFTGRVFPFFNTGCNFSSLRMLTVKASLRIEQHS